MSRETSEWLNTNTLIGFTEKRGKAWHSRKGYDNHYPGAIPVEDVKRRLFDWTAEERHLYVERPGKPVGPVPGRKAVVRSDTEAVLGVFADGYQPHDYSEWLLDNVGNILDDNLQIGTAGLLRGGGVAWAQVEVPETLSGPGGVLYRPFLLAATSLDGTMATTYGRAVTNTVCDNTMAVALTQHGGQRMKVRHSRNSLGRITDVREALGIVYAVADDFNRQLEELLNQSVSEVQFHSLLDSEVPLPEKKQEPAIRKREYLWDLYRHDARVAPWTGTALGAWQAFNTYEQHESGIRKGTNRVERNALRMVTSKQEKRDTELLDKIMELAS